MIYMIYIYIYILSLYLFISTFFLFFYSGNEPGYQGQQEIVCLVRRKRASIWEGGSLNGRLSPRKKETQSHWISSLTVRFQPRKVLRSYHVSCVVYEPYKLTCDSVTDFIIPTEIKFLFSFSQISNLFFALLVSDEILSNHFIIFKTWKEPILSRFFTKHLHTIQSINNH